MNEEDFCPKCGGYIDVDFSYYREDGRPVYSSCCPCGAQDSGRPEPVFIPPPRAPKSLAKLGDLLQKKVKQ